MSTVQQAKPRLANQSMTDESGRPGTARSNVGCDAIEEPCTNSSTGFPSGDPTNFSHRKSRIPFFDASCATPCTESAIVAAASASITPSLLFDPGAGIADDLCPQVLLLPEERS